MSLGFMNGVLVGPNADFHTTNAFQASINNGLITNGELWIGSTALNAGGTHINVGTLTSPNGTITISYSSPNITLDISEIVTNYTNVVGPITYTVLGTDEYISCDPSGGAITINFPNAPKFKYTWIIKDRTGSAATHNITLSTPGGTVTFDGLTSYIMNSNYQAIQLLANATPTYEVY